MRPGLTDSNISKTEVFPVQAGIHAPEPAGASTGRFGAVRGSLGTTVILVV